MLEADVVTCPVPREHPQDKTLLIDHTLSCVVSVTGKKLSSDLGPSKTCLVSLFLKKKIHTHMDFVWSKCIYNSSNNPQVILTGSALRHGCSSFCHPDKSSIVLKPLEISLG